MNIKDYSREAENTRADLENKGLDNIHMLLGMNTEVGELADNFKKAMAYGKEVDWENVQEELGDLMWYIVGFCNVNGFDLEEVLEKNISKLKARYPNKFSTERALNRNIDEEARAMKSATFKSVVEESTENGN